MSFKSTNQWFLLSCNIFVFVMSRTTPSTSIPKTPKYKHQKDIARYAPSNCPPSDSMAKNVVVFRGVLSPLSANDFKTYINLNKLPRATEQIHICCMRCGLSMYVKKEDAQKAYDRHPKKQNFPFTHIAKGEIKKEHGVCTVPRADGHFTFHEFEGVDLLPFFKIIGKIAAA